MYWNSFVYFCAQIITPIYIIYKPKNSIAGFKYTFQFRDISRIFTRLRACAGMQTEITFHFFWKAFIELQKACMKKRNQFLCASENNVYFSLVIFL